MGLGHSPSIVLNGLVLALDAGNPKSYPSTPAPVALTGVGETPANVFDLNVNSFSQGGVNAALTWTGNIFLGTGKYYIIVQAWGGPSQGPIGGVTLTVGGVDYTTDYSTLRGTNTDILGQTIGQGGTPSGEQRRSNLTPLGSGALTSITLSAVGGGFRNYFYAVVFVPSGVSDTNFANHVVVTNSLAYPTTWTDLSGRGNTGTLTNGPTYSSANGGSIVFDGTNDYTQLTSQNLKSVDFSVEVWFYATKAVSSTQILYTSYNLPGGAQGNTLVFAIGAGKVSADNGFGTGVTGTTTISTNTWYHAVATYTASTSTIRSYVNGILQGSAVSPITSGASSNFIGGSPGDNNLGTAWFGGSIPVVRAYRTKALSAAEVSQNYNALRGRFSV